MTVQGVEASGVMTEQGDDNRAGKQSQCKVGGGDDRAGKE